VQNIRVKTVTERFNSELKLHVNDGMMSPDSLELTVQVKQPNVIYNTNNLTTTTSRGLLADCAMNKHSLI